MKITKVNTYFVRPRWGFVEIETDSGYSGWGEAVLEGHCGAVLACVGWLTFTRLFSFYVERFSHYSNVYGSVYAVALSMLWLYCCLSIVFYGGALNRLLMDGEMPDF